MRPSANKPILITLVLFILFVAYLCKPIKNELKTLHPITYQDLTEDQKTAFNQCIESFPSDFVCDSCLTLIVNK